MVTSSMDKNRGRVDVILLHIVSAEVFAPPSYGQGTGISAQAPEDILTERPVRIDQLYPVERNPERLIHLTHHAADLAVRLQTTDPEHIVAHDVE
jgi:hypothetical protein